MLLHCQKTGHHWPCTSMEHADQMARERGLKEYHVTPGGVEPLTMKETWQNSLNQRASA